MKEEKVGPGEGRGKRDKRTEGKKRKLLRFGKSSPDPEALGLCSVLFILI